MRVSEMEWAIQVQILILSLASCVTWDILLALSGLRFSRAQVEGIDLGGL